MSKRFIALVPMRANSQRVKNKNLRMINGKPLFYYVLEALQQCKKINKIVVNTDSEVIKKKLRADFKDVVIINRPKELTDEFTSMNSIISYDIDNVEGEYFIQTHATNPLLESETVDKAIELFLKSEKTHDSLLSVNRIQKRCYDQNAKPINHDLNIMLRTQDLNPVYEENSCIFIFTRNSFKQSENRVGKNPILFEMDSEESLDIDVEFDMTLAGYMLSNREK